MDRIAKDTQFGNVSLLDGSAGTNAVTNGANLQFIGASEKSQGSGVNGYGVTITHASTRAEHVGVKPLSQSAIDAGEQITITEGARRSTSPLVRGRRWSKRSTTSEMRSRTPDWRWNCYVRTRPRWTVSCTSGPPAAQAVR